MAIVCGHGVCVPVCVYYLQPRVGRLEPRWGNLLAASIGGAFLKGIRMAKSNVSTTTSPLPPDPTTTSPTAGPQNPRSPKMSSGGVRHQKLFLFHAGDLDAPGSSVYIS